MEEQPLPETEILLDISSSIDKEQLIKLLNNYYQDSNAYVKSK